jgi:hypothetical protein
MSYGTFYDILKYLTISVLSVFLILRYLGCFTFNKTEEAAKAHDAWKKRYFWVIWILCPILLICGAGKIVQLINE